MNHNDGDHNDGDHNDGDHNDGDHNDGDHNDGDIAVWIELLKEGDQDAIERIWKEFFPRLVRLASVNLKATRTVEDEEDVALSAFKSFVKRANQFPKLFDKDDLWCLMLTITLRKCFHHNRDYGKNHVEAREWLEKLASREPTPDDAAAAADEIKRVLELLPDDRAREIVLIRLEGEDQTVIADRIGCSITTVERKLSLARMIFISRA